MKAHLKFLAKLISTGVFLSIGFLTELTGPTVVRAAEEIRLIVGGPALVFSLSVDSIDTFSQTGQAPDDLRLFATFLDEERLNWVRQTLQRPIPLNLTQTGNIAYSTLGRDALQNLGKVIRIHPDINGYYGLRAAVVGAAAEAGPEGWTVVDMMRQFPSRTIDIRLKDLLKLRQTVAVYLSYNQAAIAAIQQQSALEAERQVHLEPSTLRDLTQPGSYPFEQEAWIIPNPSLRQTTQGIQVNYDIAVDAYLPQNLTQPAPIVIVSHGFGSDQESFAFIAEHLASHGFAVFVPNHVGSNLSARQNFLQGFLNTLLSPMEFISRPQEISFLIDELEQRVASSPEWAAQFNLDQIGVMGDSLGGSTALALAGAEINFSYLENNCNDEQLIFNFALYLQCQARFLPPQDRSLRDPRIQAVVATHSLGAGLYGPEGLGEIEIPLLMVSGSQDIVAQAVTEQIHPFTWIQSEPKYLALLNKGTHFTAKPGREGTEGFIQLLAGDHRDIGSRYLKGLSVAFWKAHLQDQLEYLPYLTARYGQWLSADEPLSLDIIQSLTAEDLIAAYGGQPPIPIRPRSLTAPLQIREETVLAEIERVGVLKVALRQDAAPLGYIDDGGNWTGYCRELAADLQAYVSQTIERDVEVGLVELPSTLGNRFSLVQDDSVHLECGPNTIRQDIEDVTFSLPLLVSGTQFLVPQERLDLNNPNPRLENVRVAVLPETTTEQFIRETFPQADVVPFSGPAGRSEAFTALTAGQVDVFASDGVLLMGEVLRQNQTLAEYAVVPERPLTCEFYGLILPADDPDWQTLINNFVLNTHEERLARQTPGSILGGQLELLDFCFNQ